MKQVRDYTVLVRWLYAVLITAVVPACDSKYDRRATVESLIQCDLKVLHGITTLQFLETTNALYHTNLFPSSILFNDPRFLTESSHRTWYLNTNVTRWRDCAFSPRTTCPTGVALCLILRDPKSPKKEKGFCITFDQEIRPFEKNQETSALLQISRP